jgi:hypothetical protein
MPLRLWLRLRLRRKQGDEWVPIFLSWLPFFLNLRGGGKPIRIIIAHYALYVYYSISEDVGEEIDRENFCWDFS